jgi:hypothetical protein
MVPGYVKNLPWVDPKIVEEDLVATRTAFARSVRASEVGAVPRFMHRLVIDGAVFGHKKRIDGCSVLVDCSGSMGLSEEDLKALIAKYPAGTIAGYSGDHVRILANRGRAAVAMPEWQGTNECDGPALEWLCRQSAPRVWVTDLGVTLRGDNPSSKALNHCLALTRFADIKVVRSIAEVLEPLAA